MEITAIRETNDIFEQKYFITAKMYMSHSYSAFITNTCLSNAKNKMKHTISNITFFLTTATKQ